MKQKSVFVETDRPSTDLVCHIHSAKPIYPANWPRPVPEQVECFTPDDVKAHIAKTGAEKVVFYFRAAGIPNRPIPANDTAKLDRALKALFKAFVES